VGMISKLELISVENYM